MIEVKLPVYIKNKDEVFITPERIHLLKKIKETGSLNAAAKTIPISYQNAWSMIDEMNKLAPSPIVIKQRGGNGGGGAGLSDYGNILLKEYEYIENEVIKFTSKLNNEINM